MMNNALWHSSTTLPPNTNYFSITPLMTTHTTPTTYIAAFGRTFVDSNAPSYQLSSAIGATLSAHNVGVITGGYAGGLMQAVAQGATVYAKEQGYSNPESYAHGVPILEFDTDHDHIAHTLTLPSKENTMERLQHFSDHASAFVVLPEGGFGTFDEIIHVIRENVTHLKQPKHLILVGQHWMDALKAVFTTINSRKDPASFDWIHVVDTIEEFTETLEKILPEIITD